MRPTPAVPRKPGRRAGLLVLVGALAIAVSSCGYSHPNNRPTTIPGQSNGRLAPSLLAFVTIDCDAYSPAARDLRRMINDAFVAGVWLVPAECYRDYAGQVYWRNHWCGLGQCQMAAVPGTSNHGWGKAVDFANLSFGAPDYTWLQQNAWRYGWNHPGWAEPGKGAEEPWHWEWVGDGGTMYSGRANDVAPDDEDDGGAFVDR